MAKNKEKLLAEFPPVTTEQWEEVIAKDLKGADYQKKLVWKTAEGFDVRPYYRAEDLKGLQYLGSAVAEYPYVRGTKTNNDWLINQTLVVGLPKETNKRALVAIAKGTQSISFDFDNCDITREDLDVLLDGIDVTKTHVVFRICSTPAISGMIYEKFEADGVDPEKAHFMFVLDPIVLRLSLSGSFGGQEDGSTAYKNITNAIRKGAKYKKLRIVGVGAHNFHNAGSTIVQELAFGMAAGHEYIANLLEYGLSIDQIAERMHFSFAVSSNYFMEIAKLRAARMLWAQIVRKYKPQKGCSERIVVNALTSQWNLTAYDPYVNMLRGTTEAMSAAIAGVDFIEVLPFNFAYEHPTEFSSRIARNVQHLLKNEAHFDSVVDAGGGSYYIETLTNNVAEQAWKLFLEVEERGGYVKAFRDGWIQDQIEASAARKNSNIATRREILLGTNQYPNFGEKGEDFFFEELITPKLDKYEFGHEGDQGTKVLKPYRGAEPFEKLRARVDLSGRNPKAFMLTVGSLAMARARAQFAGNFFGCAGIQPMDNTFFASVEEGVKEALASKAEIVVICAADDDYAALAPEAYKLLGGKAIFVVAGAPESRPELEAQGITNFISVRNNVLETLTDYVAKLGIK